MTRSSNRLAREAARRVEIYTLTAAASGFTMATGLLALLVGSPMDTSIKIRLCLSPLFMLQSIVMATRWRRRARWFDSTERWWERLDEAPPVIPMPKVSEFMDRPLTWRSAAVLLVGSMAGVAAGIAVINTVVQE